MENNLLQPKTSIQLNNKLRSEQLARASKDLMLNEPFYGMFLIMLNKSWDNSKVPTAGVGRNGINYNLWLNETFWDTLTANQKIQLLKHELLHIGFFHLTNFSHLTDSYIANIAMDLEINQYLRLADLPPGPQLITNYPELNLEAKKGTNYYYEELMKGKKNGNCPNLNKMLAAAAMGEITVMIEIDGNNTESQVPDHSTHKEFQDLDEATQKLIKAQTEHILKEVADAIRKSRGTVPGEFKGILEEIDYSEPPKFDWKRFVRRFAGNSTKTYTKKLYRKFNKRFEGMPGLKIKQRNHILVGVDVSGSVSNEGLKEFFLEIYHIFKGGTDVTVLQCDAAIKNIAPYKRNLEDGIKIFGRGGTNFQPIIDYANEHSHKFTSLIVFTDGEAPAPEKCRLRTLWVHDSSSKINEDLIGLKIKLN